MCNSPDGYNELLAEQKKELQDWIKGRCKRQNTKNSKYSSYILKDIFEHDRHGFFITNGQFKGAMKEAGYLPCKETEQNWHFRIKFYPLANDWTRG